MPMRRRRSTTFQPLALILLPSSKTSPSTRAPSTRSFMRLKQRSSVDLPQPLGPLLVVLCCCGLFLFFFLSVCFFLFLCLWFFFFCVCFFLERRMRLCTRLRVLLFLLCVCGVLLFFV